MFVSEYLKKVWMCDKIMAGSGRWTGGKGLDSSGQLKSSPNWIQIAKLFVSECLMAVSMCDKIMAGWKSCWITGNWKDLLTESRPLLLWPWRENTLITTQFNFNIPAFLIFCLDSNFNMVSCCIRKDARILISPTCNLKFQTYPHISTVGQPYIAFVTNSSDNVQGKQICPVEKF